MGIGSSLTSGHRRFAHSWNQQSAAGVLADQVIFTALEDVAILAAVEVHSVVGGSGAVLQLTKDTGSQAPGAGTDLLSNTSNTGFALTGTVNVPQYAAFKPGVSRILRKGDRISIDTAGTLTGVAGVTVTVLFNRLG